MTGDDYFVIGTLLAAVALKSAKSELAQVPQISKEAQPLYIPWLLVHACSEPMLMGKPQLSYIVPLHFIHPPIITAQSSHYTFITAVSTTFSS